VLPQRFVTGTRREDWLPAAQPIHLSQPEPHSMLVWVDDQGVARARDGATGRIIAESGVHAAVLQAALDRLSGVQKEKVVLRGTFYLKRNVYVPSNAVVEGGKLVIDPSVGANGIAMLALDGASNVDIVGVEFDGNERNITRKYTEAGEAPVHVGIMLRVCSKVRILNCRFYDIAREAIWITQAGATQPGVFEHEDILVEGNVFEQCGYASTIETTRRAVFAHNVVRGFGYSSGAAPYAFSLNYLSLHDIAFIGNVIDGIDKTKSLHGINQGGNTDLRHIVIEGNVFRNLAGWAVRATHATVVGNRIENVGSGLDGTFAESLIARNYISTCSDIGINVGAGNTDPSNTIIEGNTVEDCALAHTITETFFAIGTWNGGRVTRLVIRDNTILQNATGKLRFGIFLVANPPVDCRIEGNTISIDGGGVWPTPPAAGITVRRNQGYPTEATGAATIPAGSASVTVNHGLAAAPTKVVATPTANLGAVWITNITSTSFTINCSTAPAAATVVYWYAEI
jgi:hypothetical protein